jgi:hypothetical protein
MKLSDTPFSFSFIEEEQLTTSFKGKKDLLHNHWRKIYLFLLHWQEMTNCWQNLFAEHLQNVKPNNNQEKGSIASYCPYITMETQRMIRTS